MTTLMAPHGDVHDFDFLVGRWRVHNRRLATRLRGAHDWKEFDATHVDQVIATHEETPGGSSSGGGRQANRENTLVFARLNLLAAKTTASRGGDDSRRHWDRL